ncbi:MAG: ATP synthase F1 subunit epsilon [Paracoccaceae bacterium]|nr:ATP synthase F1 subunit epsilon [Paracoccaceae bacterium]
MVAHITFHLVSPEKKLASIDAKSVSIPGIEGDMTLLPSHADFLTTLRPGVIKIEASSGSQEFVVTGGFVEVSSSVATVLAEKAVLKGEADRKLFEPFIAEAEEESVNASDKGRARSDLRVNDLKVASQVFD